MKFALSIDGGGIRGIVPARIISWLEDQIGPCHEAFQLICGTSTGGILAAGLAHPANYAAKDLLQLYLQEGQVIFKRNWWDPVAALQVKYPATGLQAALYKYYRDAKLSEATTDILITAFDEVTWKPKLFNSRKARLDKKDDALLAYAAQATASAPTYFPSCDGLVDGGVLGATNPAMIAFTEAYKTWPLEPFALLSIGTGCQDGSVDPKKADGWGELHLLRSVVKMAFDGPEKIVEYETEELLGANYFRIQGLLPVDPGIPSTAMDDASETNMKALVDFADQIIIHCKSELERFVELFKKAKIQESEKVKT